MNSLKIITLIYIFFSCISYNLEWFYIMGSFGYADLILPPLLIITLLNRNKIQVDGIFFLLVGLAIITCASTLYAASFHGFENISIGYLIRSLFFVGLYLLIKNSPVTTEAILKTILLSLLFSLCLCIYIWSTNPRYFGFTALPMLHIIDSPTGLSVNRNESGLFASLLFVISFYCLIYRELFEKKFMALVCLFSFLAVVFSFSKGAWILSIVGFLIISSFKFGKLQSIYILLLLPILLSIDIGVDIGLLDSIASRITGSQETNSYRLIYIFESIQIGVENFFLGIGPGNYQEYTIQNGLTVTVDPHNAYTQTFAELGILGLFMVIIIYSWSILNGYFITVKKSDIRLIVFVFIFLLFMDGFQSGLSLSVKITYIFLALLTKQPYVRQKN